MAYYFTIETKRGEFKPVSISDSVYFQNTIRKYKKPCAYSLEEIDNFTMMFDDELELRERLVIDGTIQIKDFDKPLSIRYSQKDKFIKVPNDFLYQCDIEFVAIPQKLIEHILKRFYNNDFLLIKRIVNKFSEHHRCQVTLAEVRQFIEISIRDGKRYPFLDEIDENGDNLITRLIKLIILESKDDYRTGKVIYTNKLNYRNLHDLIALIRNYDKDLIKQLQSDDTLFTQSNNQIDEKNSQTEIVFEKGSKEIDEEKPVYVKKRTLGRKKYNLDNQTSFEI